MRKPSSAAGSAGSSISICRRVGCALPAQGESRGGDRKPEDRDGFGACQLHAAEPFVRVSEPQADRGPGEIQRRSRHEQVEEQAQPGVGPPRQRGRCAATVASRDALQRDRESADQHQPHEHLGDRARPFGIERDAQDQVVVGAPHDAHEQGQEDESGNDAAQQPTGSPLRCPARRDPPTSGFRFHLRLRRGI